MIEHIGNSTLFLALFVQLIIAIVKLGSDQFYRDQQKWMIRLHLFSSFTILISLLTLVYGFISHSYQLTTVFQNSDDSMSLIELMVATWAGREGVLLLWATLASFFTLFVLYYFSNDLDNGVINRSLSIQVVMNVLITAFNLAGGSTPFATGSTASDGLGISPSLDSIWQQIHPPMAFIAYSAFIFPFALGVAALIDYSSEEKASTTALIIARRMMMVGWAFVTLLIIAGSIWAYEAAWNGFWAWDPIEVASLIMWALVTVYFHTNSLTDDYDPLRLTTMTFGWIGVSFASFVVRSGLWEGFHGYIGIEKAIVFGSIFLLSIMTVIVAINKSGQQIIPDHLYQIREKTAHVLTWWTLVAIAVINVMGLIVQLINNIGFKDDTIPYEYYMALNGLTFLSLVILLLRCDINRSIPNTQLQVAMVTIGAILTGYLFFQYLSSFILVLVLSSVVGGVIITQIVSMIKNIVQKRDPRRIRTQFIHLSILMLLLPYFVVDYSTERVNMEVNPGVEIHVEEFDISFILTKQFEDLDQPYPIYHLEITDKEGNTYQREIHQGEYKGEFWSRGTWITEPMRDIYFLLLDTSTGFIVNPNAPVNLEISEKPYANLYRISLVFQSLMAVIIIAVAVKQIEPEKLTEVEIK